MRSMLLQPLKQPYPNFVTDLGMVMAVKLLHQKKHLPPKVVTELGMVMAVKLLQP